MEEKKGHLVPFCFMRLNAKLWNREALACVGQAVVGGRLKLNGLDKVK